MLQEEHNTNTELSPEEVKVNHIGGNNVGDETNTRGLRRPSAAKKYAGQIMLGIGKLAISLLQYSTNPIDRLVVEMVLKQIIGKKDHEYRVNTVEKIRTYFVIEPEDDLITRAVKIKFHALVINFFSDHHYNYWLNRVFKGSKENKSWYQINQHSLKERIITNSRRTFYADISQRPYGLDPLTVTDTLAMRSETLAIRSETAQDEPKHEKEEDQSHQ